MRSTKRILVVTQTFYPENNPRSIRWQALIREIQNRGWSVDIVTNIKPKDDLFSIYGRLETQTTAPKAMPSKSTIKFSFAQRVKFKVRKLLKLFVWPDYT